MSEVYISCPYRKFMRRRLGGIHNRKAAYITYLYPVVAFCELGRRFQGFLAMTLGSKGAMAWIGNQCIAFPGIKVNAIDTSGAGDIFHGGFCARDDLNWNIAADLRGSSRISRLICANPRCKQETGVIESTG